MSKSLTFGGQGENNAMYGKTHSEQTKTLMRLARTGKVVDANTKEKMSKAKGTAVYLYAACLRDSTEKFCLIKNFTSIRQAGKYLKISAGTVSRYMKLNSWFTPWPHCAPALRKMSLKKQAGAYVRWAKKNIKYKFTSTPISVTLPTISLYHTQKGGEGSGI